MAVLSLITMYFIYKFIVRRFRAIDDFFEAAKYRDFSRWFPEDTGPKDIQNLYSGFNEINRTIREINLDKEAQYIHLQKILEMVDIGIIAYNIETGDVLWANDSFRDTLDVPAFKNIRFVENRNEELFEAVFETYHSDSNSVTISVKNEQMKVLISDSIFQVEEDAFKLIAIQNIDDTLNRNESEAWKKLLSVMTHEIMNSIAPITSLAETLQNHLQLAQENPLENPLEIEDINAGISTIKSRSEGLLKFAKTYRSLNKVTNLNLSNVNIASLFNNIKLLMQPSLDAKNINVNFLIENQDLEIQIDAYLIEQVLINLLLNAVDACEDSQSPTINISAERKHSGAPIIRVTDNGKGIPLEVMDTVFVPFFSTKKTGSGIGLSLCKQIMLLHKGKIQLNSKEGKGTVVSLIF